MIADILICNTYVSSPARQIILLIVCRRSLAAENLKISLNKKADMCKRDIKLTCPLCDSPSKILSDSIRFFRMLP